MTRPTMRFRRALLLAAFLGHLAAMLLLLYLPWNLFAHAETRGGRLVGAGFTLLLCGCMALWLLRHRRTRRLGAMAIGLLLIGALGCLAGASSLAPHDLVSHGNFTQHYTGDARFEKHALANLVPEIDQLKLGSYLIPHLDPVMDQGQAERVRRVFLDIYRELRQDGAFVRAGSALGLCYEDMLSGRRRTLHFYKYVPRHLARDSYPVLVFFHGSLGNFKGYTWVLKRLADSKGYAVIAPTYGCGNWYLDRDCSVVTAIYEHCLDASVLDEESIYLVGLSNGGTGVTRAIRHSGDRYKGFILLSAVIEPEVLSSDGFAESSAGKPFLMIHGERDRRISVDGIHASEDMLRKQGLSVACLVYPEEDHFLFFSQRTSVLRDIADWLPNSEPAKQGEDTAAQQGRG